MLAKILEKQHDATGTGAVVKGPAYKQTSEEVEKLFCILESWDEKGRKEAVSQGDSVLTAQVIEELLPNIAAVKAVEPRLDKMYKKAIEPDPDLQTYGPAMKEKVLNLQSRYLTLRALAESLEMFYDAAATMARERVDAAARLKQEQARLQMQRLQQEEQDAIARSMQEKAQQRAQEAAERAAALELGAVLQILFLHIIVTYFRPY
jgi:predicted Holliday junction resolvase-like endonuclease